MGLHRRISTMELRDRSHRPLHRQFIILSRVAADPWLAGADEEAGLKLASVREILGERRLDSGQSLLTTPCRDPGGVFAFDPSLLFEGSWEARWGELERAGLKRGARYNQGLHPPASEPSGWAADALDRLEKPIEDLRQRYGVPIHYYAMLEADGDGIGAALKDLDLESLKTAVAALYSFADEAWNIVDAFHGAAFCVGGDELKARLPVDVMLEGVQALSECFNRCTETVPWSIKAGALRPTLSFGVVIAHVKFDLREVRKQTSDALKEAKRWRRNKVSKESANLV